MGFKDSALDCVEAHRLNMEVCHDFLKRHLLEGKEYGKLTCVSVMELLGTNSCIVVA